MHTGTEHVPGLGARDEPELLEHTEDVVGTRARYLECSDQSTGRDRPIRRGQMPQNRDRPPQCGNLSHGSALHLQRRERLRVEVRDVPELRVHAIADADPAAADGEMHIRRGGREDDLLVE